MADIHINPDSIEWHEENTSPVVLRAIVEGATIYYSDASGFWFCPSSASPTVKREVVWKSVEDDDSEGHSIYVRIHLFTYIEI